jgi:predicted Zn-dependent peptidase
MKRTEVLGSKLSQMPARLLFVLLLIVVWALAVELEINAQVGVKELESRVTEFTLNNGMRFIVLERHQTPVASFYTYADVGAAQETKGITGLAHLFEHMAFKGSQNIGSKDFQKEQLALAKVDRAFAALREERSKGKKADPKTLSHLEEEFRKAQEDAEKYLVPNEFGDAIDRAGGRGLNASTRADATDYFFSLPSNAVELWFYLESERFLTPVLRQFYKELNVVIEERRMRTESHPVGKLIEEFLSVAYKAHPYGEPVVGHLSDLENMTREDAEAFFRKYYIPSNLMAVIVGDVDPQRVRQLAQIYFERIPSRSKPPQLRTSEPMQEGERRVTLRLQAQSLILIGYHKPDINDPDNAVYDAIGSLVSEGRSSRLYRALVRDKKVAVFTGGFPGFPGQKYPGLFLFYAFVAPGKTNEQAEKAMDEAIERLQKEPVSTEELDGLKRRARANLVRSLEDNGQMAGALAFWQAMTGDWRNLFRQLDKINSVTPEDIRRVAQKTFTRNNRTVGVIEPLESSPAK